MARLIKLTAHNDKPVWVNPYQVAYIAPHRSHDGLTTITFSAVGPNVVLHCDVQEKPESIADKIGDLLLQN